MSIIFEERPSDSPYVEKIMRGWSVSDGSTIRPAEINWHMVFTRHQGNLYPIVVGPWSSSGVVSWAGDAEILWVKFKLGVFMPHLPTRKFLDSETILPGAASQAFWLHGAAWQFPNYENVETFLNRLVRDDTLVHDPVVSTTLAGHLPEVASRTVRHRFLRATGLTQSHVRQFERAQDAATLLQEGAPILDVVYQLGYFDQPHLTRALKRFVGKTPAQLLRLNESICHSVQDSDLLLDYTTNVLAASR